MRIPDPNRRYQIFNAILWFVYIPMMLFCFFMGMASESIMDANNPTYISIIEIYCGINFFNLFLWFPAIPVANVLWKKEHRTWARVVRLLPLGLFVLNFAFLGIADYVPRVI
ncbi:MAG: hypothetical protein IKM59_00500 [Oscillospiraceae bacterium]|nr:hypothetical protein [Oscillospiraceae bacterium]